MDMHCSTRQGKKGPVANAVGGRVTVWPPRGFTVEHRRKRRPMRQQGGAR